jgi:hypothetical protein
MYRLLRSFECALQLGDRLRHRLHAQPICHSEKAAAQRENCLVDCMVL